MAPVAAVAPVFPAGIMTTALRRQLRVRPIEWTQLRLSQESGTGGLPRAPVE